MATFVFSGDPKAPGTDPAECGMVGMVFPLNKPVEVSDEGKAEKLRRHSHFTEVTGKAPAIDTTSDDDGLDDMKIADLRELAEQRGIDHTDMSKAELREALRAA